MIVDYMHFDYEWFRSLDIQKRKRGNNATSQKYYYLDLITAFDIETTYIKEVDESVMYIWQWQFGSKCTVVGRTWYDLRRFIVELQEILGKNRLMIFVHNLSFEFQYLSGVFEFETNDVFCIDHRKVLKALLYGCFEFRCSYLQTNLSLRSFCEKMGVKSYKLKMNYKKLRFWYTELTPKELAYCINDVRGLVEAISKEMERDGDNLYTLPLTSTGYARRDAKRAMHNVSKSFIQNQLPDVKIYELCREAFRGGNTHASRYYSNQILEDLNSIDIASAYPSVIVNDDLPVSKFTILKTCDLDKLEDLIYKKHKAVLVRCSLFNLQLKDDLIPVPYIPISKTIGAVNALLDNGRILSADVVGQITLTDIDYKIIKKQYDFEIAIITVATARYGKLPAPLRDCVMDYFRAKTSLKDKPGDNEHSAAFYKLLYDKSKNLLNAQYGMMAQSVKDQIKYINDPESLYEADGIPLDILIKDHNKRAFLAYQWGCWITARCRERLQAGIDLLGGTRFVYCDTDSCKFLGSEIDLEALNKASIKKSENNKTYADDPNGKRHYMGVFEVEDHIKSFKTMGAKKYAYIDDNDILHITIAGVNKKIGAIELQREAAKRGVSPLEVMDEGFVFKYAGGLEARYSDTPKVTEWTNKDGVKIRITRNVSLVENTKTLGLTNEYRELLKTVQKRIVL